MNHVGVIVNDLCAANEFFIDSGLEVKGEWEIRTVDGICSWA